MNELYIPGDLVMTNGLYGGTAKDVIYKIVSSDPSHIHVLSDGTVLKGLFRLKNLEGAKIEDKGYLRYGCCYINFKDIVSVPLTSEILEKNGWGREDGIFGVSPDFKKIIGDPARKKDITYLSVYPFFDDDGFTFFYNNQKLAIIHYVHELQHLLFGLGINEEWL